MNWLDLFAKTINDMPEGLGAIICIVLIWTVLWITFGKYEVPSHGKGKEIKEDS